MKIDKINSFKTSVKNLSWHVLGANLVSTIPNIGEELKVLDFKRKHAILNGRGMALYEPRKNKCVKKESRRTFQMRNIKQNTEGEIFFSHIFYIIKEPKSNLPDFLTAVYLKK